MKGCIAWRMGRYSALSSHNTVSDQKTVTELTVDSEHGTSLPSSDQILYSSSK